MYVCVYILYVCVFMCLSCVVHVWNNLQPVDYLKHYLSPTSLRGTSDCHSSIRVNEESARLAYLVVHHQFRLLHERYNGTTTTRTTAIEICIFPSVSHPSAYLDVCPACQQIRLAHACPRWDTPKAVPNSVPNHFPPGPGHSSCLALPRICYWSPRTVASYRAHRMPF